MLFRSKNSVNENGEETFGLLCFAEIREFSGQLDSEMEKVVLMDELPQNWTYPLIQPKLIEKYMQIEKLTASIFNASMPVHTPNISPASVIMKIIPASRSNRIAEKEVRKIATH